MEGGDSEFANFTLPTLKAFLEACSHNVSVNKQWLVARAIGCPKTYFLHELAIHWSAEKRRKDTSFFHPPSPFPRNFCNCNSGGICTASQFYVQLSLLYTVWSNAYSEIGREVTLRPLATSCAKDNKGHSLMQTSFTEPPNTVVLSLHKGNGCLWREREKYYSV